MSARFNFNTAESEAEIERKKRGRSTIFDIVAEQKKQKQLSNANAYKSNIITAEQAEAIPPKVKQTYFNKDAPHIIQKTSVGTREHIKIRKQVLEEEGYNVE